MSVRVIYRNKTSKEVALPMPFDYLYEIIIKLFAVFGFPVIVPLINWNNKRLSDPSMYFTNLHSEPFIRICPPYCNDGSLPIGVIPFSSNISLISYRILRTDF